MKKSKGFTLIESIVAMAVIAILVLLASWTYSGYVAEAKIIQIQQNLKVTEQLFEQRLLQPSPLSSFSLFPRDDFEEHIEFELVYSKRGEIVEEMIEETQFFDLTDYFEEISSSLPGRFIGTEDGTVYYLDSSKGETGGEGVNGDGNDEAAVADLLNSLCFFTDGAGTITEYRWTATIEGEEVLCPKEVVIPEEINGEKIVAIGSSAFRYAEITSVVIPESITSIGNQAFYDNKLTSLVVPDSVTAIGYWPFSGNPLKSLVIGGGIKHIDNYTFGGFASLETLVIRDGIETVWSNVFNGGNLKELTIGNTVHTIEDSAFKNNQLTSLILPESLINVESEAFRGNQLELIIIPDSVKTLGVRAFFNNKLKSVVIGSGVQIVEEATFRDNQITFVQLGVNIHTIRESAFAGNKLESVVLPYTLNNIRQSAFTNNPLTKVEAKGHITNASRYAFQPDLSLYHYGPGTYILIQSDWGLYWDRE